MSDKSFFIDTTKCTACRGCQVACKQWNMNPATKTTQRGTHQNPEDLSSVTYKLVRFSEYEMNGKPVWYFFPDQCRHCITPPCKLVSDSLGLKAITKDEETGAVLYNPKVKVKKEEFHRIRKTCPWDIPRWDAKTQGMAKCTMCIDRVQGGLLPACVKACPTGTMNFGDREMILKMAQDRLSEVKALYPEATLLNHSYLRTIFLVIDNPKKYHIFASVEDEKLSVYLNKKTHPSGLGSILAG